MVWYCVARRMKMPSRWLGNIVAGVVVPSSLVDSQVLSLLGNYDAPAPKYLDQPWIRTAVPPLASGSRRKIESNESPRLV